MNDYIARGHKQSSITNNINCCHQWVPGTVSTAGTMYVCAICGATKMEHYNTDGYVRNITNY